MIFYPMVISAVAVLVTLIYASYLDIRDRRVPFRTWYPMLVVGISATIVLFYQQTGNISLIVGYLTLIASFFYADYLDNHDPEPRSGSPTSGSSLPFLPSHGLLYRPFQQGNCPTSSSFPGTYCLPGCWGTSPTGNTKNSPGKNSRQNRSEKMP